MLLGNRNFFKSASDKNKKIQKESVFEDFQSVKKVDDTSLKSNIPLVHRSIDGIIQIKTAQINTETVPEKIRETTIPKEISEVVPKVVSDPVVLSNEMHEEIDVDPKKRSFLKLASMAGLGAVAVSMIPKKAEAYVMGASPTSSVVGVKNASNTRVNPATEETLQALVAGQSVLKFTTSLTSSGNVLVPASGKKIRVYSTRFSLTADLANVGFRFTSGGTDYERYVSPKTGGLYGANNHPNYVEGGVDQPVYCSISGSATVQINIDYLEV